MAYTASTFSTMASLKTAIESFAVTNGWSLDASGTLWKGTNYVRLSSTAHADRLTISAANSVDFATQLCPQKQSVYVPSGYLPATYQIFVNTTPDLIVVVIGYATTRVQWIAFGSIVKYGSWTGGNWFGASMVEFDADNPDDDVLLGPTFSAGGGSPYYRSSSAAMFWNGNNVENYGGSLYGGRSTHLHCELDGYIWPGAGSKTDPFPSFPQYADPIHSRTPNTWNAEAVMTPLWLFFPRPDGYFSPIGHVEHVRSIRITNYNPGDVITLGSEKWKVFPWFQKNTAQPDGGVYGHTGTFGFAVRYDGP